MNKQLLENIKNAIADAAETGFPQQLEMETSHGKMVILVARLYSDDDMVPAEELDG